jgi:hypothetical protein
MPLRGRLCRRCKDDLAAAALLRGCGGDDICDGLCPVSALLEKFLSD